MGWNSLHRGVLLPYVTLIIVPQNCTCAHVLKDSNIFRTPLFLITNRPDTQDTQFFISKLLKFLILLECSYT